MLKLRNNISALLFIVVLVGGCSSSTKLISTWRDPRFEGPIKFNKTLAIAVNKDPMTRRVTEDAIVAQIAPGRAAPAYQVLTDADRVNGQVVMEKAKALGFDGIVSMRLLGNQVRPMQTTQDDENGFYTFYDGGMVMVGDPGPLQTEKVTSIETRIYSVADAMPIWSGVSQTIDLSTIKEAVGEIAKAVRSELRKEKLLP
jgi:hypothetical protein